MCDDDIWESAQIIESERLLARINHWKVQVRIALQEKKDWLGVSDHSEEHIEETDPRNALRRVWKLILFWGNACWSEPRDNACLFKLTQGLRVQDIPLLQCFDIIGGGWHGSEKVINFDLDSLIFNFKSNLTVKLPAKVSAHLSGTDFWAKKWMGRVKSERSL
jgi:hypothetical protein